MKWFSRLFRNNAKMQLLIGVFIAVAFIAWSCESRGDELVIEGGSGVVRGATPVLGLNIEWPGAGPVNTDYEFGFNLIGSSEYNGDNPNAVTLHAMLWDGWKRAELGLGFAWTNSPQTYHCAFTFSLGARYRVTDRLAVQWRHFSSAGSCKPNTGRDLVTVGWRF